MLHKDVIIARLMAPPKYSEMLYRNCRSDSVPMRSILNFHLDYNRMSLMGSLPNPFPPPYHPMLK